MTIESFSFKSTKFLLSAPTLRQCPEDSGCEVAFCWALNAGKSSAINTLTQNKTMARTSKTPDAHNWLITSKSVMANDWIL